MIRTDRRRQGLHFRRNPDDKVYCDSIVLTRDDGELTTVTMDEFTQLRKLVSEAAITSRSCPPMWRQQQALEFGADRRIGGGRFDPGQP